MILPLSWAAQQAIIWAGHYLAFASWAVLATLAVRYLIKKDWTRFKITLLYILNSLVFLVAWWMCMGLALIVVTPIEDTREHSVDIVWNEANRYFSDYVQLSVVALLIFTALNVVYMRYVVRRSVLHHSVILFLTDSFVLFSGVYLSVGSYYAGMLQEIDRYFLGQ